MLIASLACTMHHAELVPASSPSLQERPVTELCAQWRASDAKDAAIEKEIRSRVNWTERQWYHVTHQAISVGDTEEMLLCAYGLPDDFGSVHDAPSGKLYTYFSRQSTRAQVQILVAESKVTKIQY